MLIVAHKNNQAGFTLIEITLIIVAIAFLILGVLKGGDVIRTGKLNKVAADINKYELTAAAFKSKFLYLPGDMDDARDRLSNCSAPNCFNGNRDGIVGRPNTSAIRDQTGTGAPERETTMFWKHLFLANYITGVEPDSNPAAPLMSVTHPTSPVGGAYGVFQRRANARQAASHGISLKACPNTDVCGGSFMDARDVAYLDTKIDGSLDPSRGQIIGGGNSCSFTTGAYTYNAAPCYMLYLTDEF